MDEQEVYDMFGERIERGCVICYASSSTMKMGIVNKIVIFKNYYNSIQIHLMSTTTYRTKKGRGERIHNYHISCTEKELQNKVMVLKDPLFYINNERIAKQIHVADVAKEKGVLPDSYELGRLITNIVEVIDD